MVYTPVTTAFDNEHSDIRNAVAQDNAEQSLAHIRALPGLAKMGGGALRRAATTAIRSPLVTLIS